MGKRWVYMKTTPKPQSYSQKRDGKQDWNSVRVEVVGRPRVSYTVRMPDGEEREVTDDDLVFNRRALDPIDTEQDSASWRDDGDTVSRHPSFGMIGIFHTSGYRPIHGSKIDSHQHYVSIRIKGGAEEHHALGENWHYGGGSEIIEVALSPARFAEFVATSNRGDGVPCSIVRHSPIPGPGMIPAWPKRDTEASRVIDRIKGLGDEITKKQDKARATIEASISKLSEKKKREILSAFDQGARVLNDSAPFLVSQATRALEHRVVEAKSEVEAFVSTTFRAIGEEEVRKDPNRLVEQVQKTKDSLQIEAKDDDDA